MNANLYALFETHFPDSPSQPCIMIPDGPVVHYDDLAAESARIARHAMDTYFAKKEGRPLPGFVPPKPVTIPPSDLPPAGTVRGGTN